VENNKAADIDWFRLESNKEGTRWFGKCWYIHELLKYELDVEFDVSLCNLVCNISINLPLTAPTVYKHIYIAFVLIVMSIISTEQVICYLCCTGTGVVTKNKQLDFQMIFSDVLYICIMYSGQRDSVYDIHFR